MKAFLIILAIVLGALALGGLTSAAKATDTPSRMGDIVIAAALATGAAFSGKAASRR
ncbi:hypothetical protein ABT010_37740 [Streptomyces sp. NPDC002668]|uniref:hypothetical protein n=1 Tax=Streptomyces sp. NPDC002668 TaxID=3154422 RepID=UPI003317BD86